MRIIGYVNANREIPSAVSIVYTDENHVYARRYEREFLGRDYRISDVDLTNVVEKLQLQREGTIVEESGKFFDNSNEEAFAFAFSKKDVMIVASFTEIRSEIEKRLVGTAIETSVKEILSDWLADLKNYE